MQEYNGKQTKQTNKTNHTRHSVVFASNEKTFITVNVHTTSKEQENERKMLVLNWSKGREIFSLPEPSPSRFKRRIQNTEYVPYIPSKDHHHTCSNSQKSFKIKKKNNKRIKLQKE